MENERECCQIEVFCIRAAGGETVSVFNRAKTQFVMSKQLLRSGTAIGALVREAEQAESKADFIHKMAIALKEANETDYWLELLCQSGFIEEKAFASLDADAKELLKLLISIIKTSKSSR